MLFSLKLFSELTFAFPDILSALSLFALIVAKNFAYVKYSKATFPRISFLFALVSLIATLVYSSFDIKFDTGLFIYNYNLGQIKILLLSLMCFWFFYTNYTKLYRALNSNFFVLVYGMVNSITLSLSANNFLVLILALELYSFSMAFLILNDDHKIEGRKCAIRYLLTSSIMSAVFLFGCSLIYSQFGSLSFTKIKLTEDFASTIGAILIICAMLFKLGCAPFHSWMIDVYERASSVVVMFLEAIWKLFMFFIFIRVTALFLPGNFSPCRIVLLAASIMAMMFGSIMPIFQRSIHKFIATASVGHIGFLMMVFAAFTYTRSTSVVVSYLLYYSLAVVCFFTGILIIKSTRKVSEFSDLRGVINTSPMVGFLLLLSMFAMIGIPPFGNFIAKLNVFKFLLRHDAYVLLSVAMVYSVISIAYVIKWTRYFFKPVKTEPIYDHTNPILPIILLIALPVSIFLYDYLNNHFMQILKSGI